MKIPALAELKKELNYLDEKELVGLLIDLSKFSRDNKAFLHFKLHERDQPALFVDTVKEELEELFQMKTKYLHLNLEIIFFYRNLF